MFDIMKKRVLARISPKRQIVHRLGLKTTGSTGV